MSKITLIDPQTAGISGDMLLGALLDAGANQKSIQRALDKIPQFCRKCSSIQLQANQVKKLGFRACRAELMIAEEEGEVNADEFLKAAENIAQASQMTPKASMFAINTIKDLVLSESALHGSSVESTHLHEAGSADTLADVFGVALACDSLGVFESEVFSTPVAVGGGLVSFSHGTLGTPAPAVLEIARRKQIPIRGGPASIELATPTGMSMLANLAQTFLEVYPPMIAEKVGYGAGKAELKEAPNVLRLVVGKSLGERFDMDMVEVLETNLDDLPGEMLGHALERVLEGGAKDAWVTPAQFKKNRPGHVLHVICDTDIVDRLTEIIVEETGTLGVRYQSWNRFTLQREIKTVKMNIGEREFSVRVKFARDRAGKIVNIKPEFDDVQAIAKEMSMPAREVSEIALRVVNKDMEK